MLVDAEIDDSDKVLKRFKPIRVPASAVVAKKTNRNKFSLYNAKVKVTYESYSFLANSVPDNIVPLLCFVNPKSGGNQGEQVIKILTKLLHQVQVVPLSDKLDPLDMLNIFAASTKSFRVLVCGGDGSVGWVLSRISLMQREFRPPLAILPLGTGNDLARSLGWGSTCELAAIPGVLDAIMRASTILLDRWRMTVKSGSTVIKTSEFSNYCGFGVDAQVAHKFHEDRNSRPDRFVYQCLNKMWYGVLGAEEIWKKSCKGLFRNMRLYVDGRSCDIPEETEGIIFCNITSYGGGVQLWNDKNDDESAQEYASNDFLTSSYSNDVSDDVSDVVSFSSPKAGRHSQAHQQRPPNPNLNVFLNGSKSLSSQQTASQSQSQSSSLSSPQSSSLSSPQSSSQDNAVIATPPSSPRRRTSSSPSFPAPSVNSPQSIQDGLIECMAVKGTFHLVQIRFDLDNVIKLQQGKKFTLVVNPDTFQKNFQLPIQTDGEPWIQNNLDDQTVIEIERLEQSLMLERTPEGRDSDLGSEIINWAYSENIIDFTGKEKMQKEFSRRLEERLRVAAL